MSRTLDQLLSEPDEEEDDDSQDSNRLHQLLNLQDDEDDADVGDLIKTLESGDASRFKLLESKTPEVEPTVDSPDPASEFYTSCTESHGNSVDIGEYFENELKGTSKDIHFTKTPDPSAQYGDLEWADSSLEDELSRTTKMTAPVLPAPSSPSERELSELFDYNELLQHIAEIDDMLGTGPISADRSDSVQSALQRRLEYMCALGNASPIESDNTIYMGRRKVNIGVADVAYSYVIRPDIKAENVLGLLEQILMSCGGTVLRPLPEDTNRSVTFRPAYASSAEWDSIDAYMGANSRKQRVLVVVCSPSRSGASSAASSLYMSLSAPRGGVGGQVGTARSFKNFVLEVHELLCRALASEGWTLRSLTGSKGRSLLMIPMDSLVDPYFVRELHDSFLRELDVNVATISHSLLDYITHLEKQCARLMTLLRPIYDRCHIALPVPPTKHPELSQFGAPVQTTRSDTAKEVNGTSTTLESSLEMSRLIILRARRNFFKSQAGRAASAAGGAGAVRAPIDSSKADLLAAYRAEIEDVLSDIFVQLRDLCEQMAENICQRRTMLVAERVDHVEAFRLSVIHNLSQRVITTSEDRAVFSHFQSKFRIASESEPYVLDFKATLLCSTTDTGAAAASKGTIGNNNRSGIAYVTLTNIYFTSFEIFLLPMMQKVIPLKCIREVTTVKATLVASDAVCVVDMGGESSVFYVSSPAPAYAERIVDMLNVLILMQMQAEATTEQGQGIDTSLSANGESGGAQGEASGAPLGDEVCGERSNSDETLWRVRNMAIAAVKSVESVGAAYLGSVGAVGDDDALGEATENPQTSRDSANPASLISSAEPEHGVSTSTIRDMPPGKSPLARGIQAYLEKLQKPP